MNILPKKRWHVRTKENIARVRRDEALAAEEAKVEQARIEKAESEARLNFLRIESRKKNNTSASDIIHYKSEPIQSTSKTTSKHINFFEELEQGNIDYHKPNKDYEKGKKEEQEKYEKQIGYLTYLGQGVKEAVSKSWYNELPRRINDTEKHIEIKPNKKTLEDPMQDIKRYLNIMSVKKNSAKSTVKLEPKKIKNEELIVTGKKRKHQSSTDDDSSEDNRRSRKKRKSSTREDSSDDRKSRKKRKSSTDDDSSDYDRKSRKKHKKHKKHKKSKKHKRDKEKEAARPKVDIEKLRAERLEREKRERLKTQAFLLKYKSMNASQEGNPQQIFKQKYNSQFFPELARQNCDKNYK